MARVESKTLQFVNKAYHTISEETKRVYQQAKKVDWVQEADQVCIKAEKAVSEAVDVVDEKVKLIKNKIPQKYKDYAKGCTEKVAGFFRKK